MFSHDITNFEAYCSWWAFPAWESPTISMRKPGKKHNQIDVRLQCNTPNKKLLHTVKNEVVLLLAEYFQFWHSKVHENLPSHKVFGHFFAQTFIRFSWEILPGLGFVLTAHPYLCCPPPSIFKLLPEKLLLEGRKWLN